MLWSCVLKKKIVLETHTADFTDEMRSEICLEKLQCVYGGGWGQMESRWQEIGRVSIIIGGGDGYREITILSTIIYIQKSFQV